MNLNNLFDCLAVKVTRFTGGYVCFAIAVLTIIIWAICGPIFHFSETWQLIINTGTTIITFLMVFLIQYSQNKDTQALHIKIDELIKANKEVSDKYRGIENLSQEQLEQIKDGN
jgi:low affinity Fe/Cu permease